jgi:hypothetical protein
MTDQLIVRCYCGRPSGTCHMTVDRDEHNVRLREMALTVTFAVSDNDRMRRYGLAVLKNLHEGVSLDRASIDIPEDTRLPELRIKS